MMIDRKKLVLAMMYHKGGACIIDDMVCPYWQEGTDCAFQLSDDALTTLKEDLTEIETLKDELYNCRLYLTELLVDKGIADLLEKRHPGLPGYVPESLNGGGRNA